MPQPSPIDRKRYGDELAGAICALRSAGKIIAPYKGEFRVDLCPETFSADRLLRMAAEITPRKTATVRRPPGEEAGTTGNRATGPGSVLANPIQEPRSPAQDTSDSVAEPVVPTGNEGSAGERGTRRTCAKCGRPRSRESKALCAICYAQAGRGSYPARPTADVRDKFARATQEPIPAGDEPANAGGSHEPGLTPATEVARTAPPSTALCGCGKPKTGRHGKCWFMRGMAGPPGKRVYPKGRHHTSRITALEMDLAATKAELAAFKATVRDAVAELLERMDGSEGR